MKCCLLTVGRTPLKGNQPVARPLPTQDNTNRINAGNRASLGFESTIPVFEQAMTFHALDRADAVIGPPPHSRILI
jgi:hypothetical protein